MKLDNSTRLNRLSLASIIIAAAATILFQFTLTRILSFIFWNHLVYLAVTVALLGFGISGTLVALFGRGRNLQDPRYMGYLWFGFGASMFITLPASSWGLASLAFTPPWVKLGICYIVYIVPFIFSGAILSSLFAAVVRHRIGKLYAADLLASGAACGAFFFLLPALGAQATALALAFGSFAVGFAWLRGSGIMIQKLNAASALAMAPLLVAAVLYPRFMDFSPEPYLTLGRAKLENPAIQTEAITWTPISRIDVVGTTDDSNPLDYPQHPKGSFKIITQDAAAHTRLLSERAIEHLHEAVSNGEERHGSNLVYRIRKDAEVAVIGVGGGVDVASALAYGAQSVTGIELNPATYNYSKNTYADYTGNLMSDPRVKLYNREGRSFLRTSTDQFDLIQVIAIDTFAALNAGAYILSENYLYTVQAFRELFATLKPGGILVFYRLLLHPPRETLRLSMIAAEAWRSEGISDFKKSFMVFGNKRQPWALSLFKRGHFTVEETQQLREGAQARQMPVLYWPKVFPDRVQKAVETADDADTPRRFLRAERIFDEAMRSYAGERQDEFFAGYQYDVTPTHDDSPFFFQYNKLGAFGFSSLGELHGAGASTTLLVILIEALVLSSIAIFLPLIHYQRDGLKVPRAGAFSTYFAAIGFGFMLVEIVLMQKAVLVLGNPMYALSVVLATLLLGAGTGAWLQSRVTVSIGRTIHVAGLTLIALLLIIALGLTSLLQTLLTLPAIGRFAAVIVLLYPVGVLMGVFLPAGLQVLRDRKQAFVPWAWGINGCTSVLGSVLAILLGLAYGFTAAVIAAALCYAAAWFFGAYYLEGPPHTQGYRSHMQGWQPNPN